MCRRAFRCAGAYLVSLLRPIQLPSLSKSMPTESPACCLQECQGWVRALYDCRHVPCMPVLYAQWYMLVVGATMCLWRPVPRRRGKRVLSFIRNTVWMKPMREVYGNTRRRRARMFLEPAARLALMSDVIVHVPPRRLLMASIVLPHLCVMQVMLTAFSREPRHRLTRRDK